MHRSRLLCNSIAILKKQAHQLPYLSDLAAGGEDLSYTYSDPSSPGDYLRQTSLSEVAARLAASLSGVLDSVSETLSVTATEEDEQNFPRTSAGARDLSVDPTSLPKASDTGTESVSLHQPSGTAAAAVRLPQASPTGTDKETQPSALAVYAASTADRLEQRAAAAMALLEPSTMSGTGALLGTTAWS